MRFTNINEPSFIVPETVEDENLSPEDRRERFTEYDQRLWELCSRIIADEKGCENLGMVLYTNIYSAPVYEQNSKLFSKAESESDAIPYIHPNLKKVSEADLELARKSLEMGQKVLSAPGEVRKYLRGLLDYAYYDSENPKYAERLPPEISGRRAHAHLLGVESMWDGVSIPDKMYIRAAIKELDETFPERS
jgi:hypothetical protein